jgi:hypothetical protein
MTQADRSPVVSFLVAGVQKAGTTALHDYLSQHPQLCLPQVKEPHFFDDDDRDWARPDYSDYDDLFADRGDRLCGECTPIYLYWPNCLERAHAYNPDMKVVVSLRDPIERAWSHYRMERARGAETLTFSKAIREGRARFSPDTPHGGYHRVYSYVERGFYKAQLERLGSIFPQRQILTIQAEELRSNPRETLDRLCDFLNVDPFATVSPLTSHEGKQPADGQALTVADSSFLSEIYYPRGKKARSILDRTGDF